MPPVSEVGTPLEVLRGLPFVAHQAKQIEMSGGVSVAVAYRIIIYDMNVGPEHEKGALK